MTTEPAQARETILGGFEKRRPLRAGSLIVTVFGDAIVPRGGSLWLGALLDIMALFGSEAGLVRTALSRLVQDGLFERSRAGKNSYYRLSPQGAPAVVRHAGCGGVIDAHANCERCDAAVSSGEVEWHYGPGSGRPHGP